MALFILCPGPYGRLRQLRQDVRNFRYELRLITEMGMRRKIGKRRLEELIKERKVEIKKILASLKK